MAKECTQNEPKPAAISLVLRTTRQAAAVFHHDSASDEWRAGYSSIGLLVDRKSARRRFDWAALFFDTLMNGPSPSGKRRYCEDCGGATI